MQEGPECACGLSDGPAGTPEYASTEYWGLVCPLDLPVQSSSIPNLLEGVLADLLPRVGGDKRGQDAMGSQRCHALFIRCLGQEAWSMEQRAAWECCQLHSLLPVLFSCVPEHKGSVPTSGNAKALLLFDQDSPGHLPGMSAWENSKHQPTEINQWNGEAFWITGGFCSLLSVVVSKLPILSTTQEAPKT